MAAQEHGDSAVLTSRLLYRNVHLYRRPSPHRHQEVLRALLQDISGSIRGKLEVLEHAFLCFSWQLALDVWAIRSLREYACPTFPGLTPRGTDHVQRQQVGSNEPVAEHAGREVAGPQLFEGALEQRDVGQVRALLPNPIERLLEHPLCRNVDALAEGGQPRDRRRDVEVELQNLEDPALLDGQTTPFRRSCQVARVEHPIREPILSTLQNVLVNLRKLAVRLEQQPADHNACPRQ
mmetsp:Transcript_96475/g.277088  ORF Transcript_96475/g.277088 Transcript_96475/m.277088 type:complete len:236 (-) Transcript_96475:622-1329(-)